MDFCVDGYDLIEQIAEGEICNVFRANCKEDGHTVVIKVMKATDMLSTQRIIREQRLLKEINHENIVQVLETGCVGIRPYIVLELIDGDSIRDVIIKKAPLPVEFTQKIIGQLASAVSTLHSQEIIHRDIKPENIMLDSSGNVKLIDFSVAAKSQEQGSLTSHDSVVGTADYMSPEQRNGSPVGKQTDQFALAAVAFEMLTGHFANGQFRRPSELNESLNESFDQVLLKGLERLPEDRYANVMEFANAFKMLSADPKPNPVAALDPSPTQPAEAPLELQNNRLPLALGATALMVLLVVVSYFKFVSDFEDSPKVASTENSALGIGIGTNNMERMTNSIGMELVKLPAGEFEFGSSEEQLLSLFGENLKQPFKSEAPSRKKTIYNSFWMGASEVTVKQFRQFVDETGYETTSETSARENGREPKQPFWKDPVHFECSDDHPVIAVSWNDANAFCNWLSEHEGRSYRLPTEVEWEYACRAGSSGPWSCSINDLGSHATFGRRWITGPSKVANNLPNAWGIHDMHGNVWEWCQDAYVEFPDTGGIQRVSYLEQAEELHVVRGGGYKAPPVTLRCASRRGFSEREPATDRGHGIGFRVVLETDSDIK